MHGRALPGAGDPGDDGEHGPGDFDGHVAQVVQLSVLDAQMATHLAAGGTGPSAVGGVRGGARCSSPIGGAAPRQGRRHGGRRTGRRCRRRRRPDHSPGWPSTRRCCGPRSWREGRRVEPGAPQAGHGPKVVTRSTTARTCGCIDSRFLDRYSRAGTCRPAPRRQVAPTGGILASAPWRNCSHSAVE